MNKWLHAGIALAMTLIIMGILGCGVSSGDELTQEESQTIAEDYVNNDPTFAFDGIEDSITLVKTDTLMEPYTWAFEFDFQCRQAGYGDRTGQALAQVITPHTARIVMQEGEVIEATIDGVWDMMKQEMLPIAVDTHTGGIFVVSLDSNPTTGYSWQAEFDDQYIELLSKDFEPSSELIGAGGVETLQFKALKEGDTEITMTYKRVWEEDYLQKQLYEVHIVTVEE